MNPTSEASTESLTNDNTWRLTLMILISLIIIFNTISLCTLLTVYFKVKYFKGQQQSSRTKTGQILTVNLTIADLLTGLVAIVLLSPPRVYESITIYCHAFLTKFVYFKTAWYCRIRTAAIAYPIIVSGITILLLALDRFLSIVFSLKYENIIRKISTKHLISLTWLFALFLVLIMSIFIREPGFVTNSYRNFDYGECRKLYRSNFEDAAILRELNSCKITCPLYFSPTFILLICFACILPLIGLVLALYIKIYFISHQHRKKENDLMKSSRTNLANSIQIPVQNSSARGRGLYAKKKNRYKQRSNNYLSDGGFDPSDSISNLYGSYNIYRYTSNHRDIYSNNDSSVEPIRDSRERHRSGDSKIISNNNNNNNDRSRHTSDDTQVSTVIYPKLKNHLTTNYGGCLTASNLANNKTNQLIISAITNQKSLSSKKRTQDHAGIIVGSNRQCQERPKLRSYKTVPSNIYSSINLKNKNNSYESEDSYNLENETATTSISVSQNDGKRSSTSGNRRSSSILKNTNSVFERISENVKNAVFKPLSPISSKKDSTISDLQKLPKNIQKFAGDNTFRKPQRRSTVDGSCSLSPEELIQIPIRFSKSDMPGNSRSSTEYHVNNNNDEKSRNLIYRNPGLSKSNISLADIRKKLNYFSTVQLPSVGNKIYDKIRVRESSGGGARYARSIGNSEFGALNNSGLLPSNLSDSNNNHNKEEFISFYSKPMVTLVMIVGSLIITWVPFTFVVMYRTVVFMNLNIHYWRVFIELFASDMTKTLSHLDHTSIDQLKEACQKDSFDFQNGKWMLILLFVNSCLNPLIYNYTNKDLKQKIHKLYKKSRNVTNEMKELNMKELSTKFRRKSLRGGSSYYNTKKCKSVLCLSTVSFNYKCNNNYGVGQGENTMNIAGLMTGERLNNHAAEAKCRMGCSVTNLALEGPVGNSNEASTSSQSQAKRTSSTLPKMKRTTVKISPDRSEKSSHGPRMKHSSSGSQSTYFQNKSIASRGSSKLAVSFPASRPSSTSPRPSPINLCRTPTEGSSSKCSSSQLVPSNSTSQDKVFPIFSSRSPNHAIPQIIGGSAFTHSKRTRSGIQVERTGSFRKGCSRRSRSSSYNHEVLSPFSIEYPNNQYRNKLMSRNTLAGMPHFSNYNSNLLSISDPISENADQETTSSSSDKKEILTNSKVEANLLKQDYSVRTLEKDSYLSVPGIQTPVNSMVLLPEEDEEDDDELELAQAKTIRKNISKSHSNLNKLGLSVSFSDLQTKLPRSISNNHALQSTKNHTSNSLSYRNNNNFYLHVPQLRSHAVQRRLSMDRISEESRYTSDREMPILKRSLTASQMSDDGYSPPIQIKNERKIMKDSNGPVTFKIG